MSYKEVDPPDDAVLSDSEIHGFGGTRDDGWSFVVVLFRGQARGEIRFAFQDVPTFVHPIGLEEIAMFAAKRWDLATVLLTRLIDDYHLSSALTSDTKKS